MVPPASKTNAAVPGRNGNLRELCRFFQCLTWFLGCCLTIHVTQVLCSPFLYFLSRDWFNAYVAFNKQQFCIVINTVTHWFTPTKIRVSGDGSVQGQLRQTSDGTLETDFPERIVLTANHQIYTEWLYLWWIAYTSRMHGALYIILKQSLKWIPMVGPAMMLFGFIFMSRDWEKDKPRMRHRLQLLNMKSAHPHSTNRLSLFDPMWLLIFPEGTNLSANTRRRSVAWATKQKIDDFDHVLLPRSTGLLFCLQELKDSVEWLYDCTIAYEGVGRDKYAQDIYTIRNTFLRGRTPTSVNMYWRRIAISSLPLHDAQAFEKWLRMQWQIKNDLIESFHQHHRFPASPDTSVSPDKTSARLSGNSGSGLGAHKPYIETEVKLRRWTEIAQIFIPLLIFALLANILAKIWNLFKHGSMVGLG